jgi:hypothetical protein
MAHCNLFCFFVRQTFQLCLAFSYLLHFITAQNFSFKALGGDLDGHPVRLFKTVPEAWRQSLTVV